MQGSKRAGRRREIYKPHEKERKKRYRVEKLREQNFASGLSKYNYMKLQCRIPNVMPSNLFLHTSNFILISCIDMY